MNETSGFHISQGLDVLAPKTGNAYPIPCDEWEFLKNKLRQVTAQPWIYQTAGSLLGGAGIATFVTILTGTLPPQPQSQAIVIAWAVVAVSAICAVACFFFAEQQRKMRSVHVSDVITQMELIERRYEHFDVASGQTSTQMTVKILSARYGAGSSYVDVTSVLVQRIDKAGLHVPVGNNLAPDPCPGTPKELVVEYEHNGQRHNKKVFENDMLMIP
jgi:hypothetical protein